MPKINPFIRPRFKIKAGTYTIDLGDKTCLMGIINLTPDSFSGDGCLPSSHNPSKAFRLAKKFIQDGADIIDLGGESTRPGSRPVSVEEELKRVIPVLRHLIKECRIPISIDTYKPLVAQSALDQGATIINNIMGVRPDKMLLKMIRNYNAAIILMHIRGTPQTMQKNIHYKDVVTEIIESLKISIENCLEIGIKSDRITIDPGIGFGKTVFHNLEILNRLEEFTILKKPIVIGTSRKSFIGKILDKKTDERLIGTLATVSASVLKGAHILRVHDIQSVKETVQIMDAILKPPSHSSNS